MIQQAKPIQKIDYDLSLTTAEEIRYFAKRWMRTLIIPTAPPVSEFD